MLVASLLLVVRPGAPSSVLAPAVCALHTSNSKLNITEVDTWTPSSEHTCRPWHDLENEGVHLLCFCWTSGHLTSSFLLLVAMPGAPRSVLAPSSKTRSHW